MALFSRKPKVPVVPPQPVPSHWEPLLHASTIDRGRFRGALGGSVSTIETTLLPDERILMITTAVEDVDVGVITDQRVFVVGPGSVEHGPLGWPEVTEVTTWQRGDGAAFCVGITASSRKLILNTRTPSDGRAVFELCQAQVERRSGG